MRSTAISACIAIILAPSHALSQSSSVVAPSVQELTPGATLEAGHFVRALSSHQWRASKLIGLDVYGTENEKIGDIVEVLMGAGGDDVVVIGTGGVMGIARREIAVPFRAVDWRFGEPPKQRASPPTSSSSSAATDVSARKTVDNSRRGYPDFAFVSTTKDGLKAAPDFTYAADEPSVKKSSVP
jgi:hypothetical protein